VNTHIPRLQIDGDISPFNGGEAVAAVKAKATWDKLAKIYNSL